MKPSVLISLFVLAITLAACSPKVEPATPTPAPTFTPDPCAGQALQATAQAVHNKMREFDDASALASVTPKDQLPAVISDLQRIRREAQDVSVPACLDGLKRLQLAHMNMVIDTLMAFLGGADADALTQGIAQARQLHDLYTLELMSILGVTLVPATPAPTQASTPAAQPPSETATPQLVMVVNPGPATVNMRAEPRLDAANLGLLQVGESAVAVGRTMDGGWILIEVPNQPGVRAWVYTSLVQLSAPIEALPGVAP